MSAATAATLGIAATWLAQYDTSTGAPAYSTVPGICVGKADPTLAASGSLLEIGTNSNYGRWPPTGRSDQSFPEALANFFGSGLIPSHSWGVGQAQLLYDQTAGRFVLAATVRDVAAKRAWIAIGTTAHQEPRGITDCTVAVDANIVATGPQTSFWADGIRLGMTQDALVISADMRAFDANGTFQYAKLWAFPKSNIYNAALKYCPSASGLYHFWSGLKNPDGSVASTVIPAKSYGNTSVTYLVAAHPNGGNTLSLWTLDSQRLTLSVRAVTTRPYSPPPPASQKATSSVPAPPPISTGDARLVNAVYQPNSGLWTVHTTTCPWNKALSCFKWYDIDPVAEKPIQDNFFGYNIDSVYAPAVAVSRNAAVFVYNASSKNHFVDVDVVGRYAGDATNVLGQSYRVQAGVDVYTRGAPAAHNGADADPTNDNRLWIVGAWASGSAGGQNAKCPNGTVNHDWITQIGNILFK